MRRIIREHETFSILTGLFPAIWFLVLVVSSEIRYQYEIYVENAILIALGLYTIYFVFALVISIIAIKQGENHAKRSAIIATVTTLLHCVLYYRLFVALYSI